MTNITAASRPMSAVACALVAAGVVLQAATAGQVRDARPGDNAVATGSAAITGVVVGADGQPIGGAQVMVMGEALGTGRSAFTDDEGRITVAALGAARYSIRAMKPGFVAASYGQRRFDGPGLPITLADGERRAVSIQSHRSGVVTGTVIDQRGDPAINAQVSALRILTTGGERRVQQMGGGQTDDRACTVCTRCYRGTTCSAREATVR